MKFMSNTPSRLAAQAGPASAQQSRRDLARAATAILRGANYSSKGEVKDKKYRRDKRAERKVSMRHWKEKQAKLGHSFGPASPRFSKCEFMKSRRRRAGAQIRPTDTSEPPYGVAGGVTSQVVRRATA